VAISEPECASDAAVSSPATSGGGAAEVLRAALAESFGPVRRYLFAMCGDWHEAEDMAAEALLRAWQGRGRFDGRAKASTWIFAIARNHWRDRLRRKRTAPGMQPIAEAPQMIEPSPSPSAVAIRRELADAVRQAVGKLPAPQREVIALRESGGLKFAEIAELLGLPVGTVKSRVRYALLKLADELRRFRHMRPEAES